MRFFYKLYIIRCEGEDKIMIFHTLSDVYEVVEKIGEGGCGQVYKVKNEDAGIFALKYLEPGKVERKKSKRFRNELNFLSKDIHKNIVKVLDWGYKEEGDKKCPFYVMKFYPKTLRELINEGLSKLDILEIFSQILDGIEATHLHGIWHRDLKPENILFDTETKTVAIADYGIAHFTEPYKKTDIETKPQDRLANFQYAAPEQRTKGRNVDHRSDIFALGLILNEMFTKNVPQGTDFIRIESISPDLVYLDDIVEQMISQSPENRPDNIDNIKVKLQVQQNAFISRQKLSILNNTVIKKFELDDPILNDPMKIISYDVDPIGSKLIFKLNHNTMMSYGRRWRKALSSVSYNGFFFPSGPPEFSFTSGDILEVRIGGGGQATTNFVKEIINRTNTIYERLVKEEMEEQRRVEELELKRKIEAEQRRKNILENIKI